MAEALKNWSEIIKNTLEGIAVLGAALWTIYRFGIFRERYAKIEFNLDCRYIGMVNGSHVIELIAILENKGMARQYIKKWTFDLLLFKEGENIDESEKSINFQVKFSDKKISARSWVPTTWYTIFLDANTKQTYTYITAIPEKTKFISLYSKFLYPDTKDFHAAQKTFELKALITPTPSAPTKVLSDV